MTTKLCLIVIIGSIFVSGCSSSTPMATPEQQKAFEGGPMPEDFRKDLEARRAAAAKDAAAKAQQKGASGG